MRNPCKDCTERHATCHGSCEEYKEWYEWQKTQKQNYQESSDRPWSYARNKAANKKKQPKHGRRYGDRDWR